MRIPLGISVSIPAPLDKVREVSRHVPVRLEAWVDTINRKTGDLVVVIQSAVIEEPQDSAQWCVVGRLVAPTEDHLDAAVLREVKRAIDAYGPEATLEICVKRPEEVSNG